MASKLFSTPLLPAQEMHVVVRTCAGDTLSLAVSMEDTLGQIKKKLAASKGIPVRRVCLLCGTTILSPDQAQMLTFGLAEGTELSLVISQPQIRDQEPRRQEVLLGRYQWTELGFSQTGLCLARGREIKELLGDAYIALCRIVEAPPGSHPRELVDWAGQLLEWAEWLRGGFYLMGGRGPIGDPWVGVQSKCGAQGPEEARRVKVALEGLLRWPQPSKRGRLIAEYAMVLHADGGELRMHRCSWAKACHALGLAAASQAPALGEGAMVVALPPWAVPQVALRPTMRVDPCVFDRRRAEELMLMLRAEPVHYDD